MCKIFKCKSCKLQFFQRCDDLAFDSQVPCSDAERNGRRSTCQSCDVINGTIIKLLSLLECAPWLADQGMAGLDSISGWQREGMEEILVKKPNSQGEWSDPVESRAERLFVTKHANAISSGYVPDARRIHQGFGVSLNRTPGKRRQDSWISCGSNSNKENESPKRFSQHA